MPRVISVILFIVGIIHLLPSAGVLGPERLLSLYGVTIDEPNLEILLRHRAVLFGILGIFLIVSAFKKKLQTVAISAATVSVFSFIILTWSVDEFNSAISRVVIVDTVAAVLLLFAAILLFIGIE